MITHLIPDYWEHFFLVLAAIDTIQSGLREYGVEVKEKKSRPSIYRVISLYATNYLLIHI